MSTVQMWVSKSSLLGTFLYYILLSSMGCTERLPSCLLANVVVNLGESLIDSGSWATESQFTGFASAM